MSPLSTTVRNAVRQALAKLPESAVEKLPDPVEQRVRTVRHNVRQEGYQPDTGVAATDNFGYNSKVWDWYADKWDDDEFRKLQLSYDGRGEEDPTKVERLGEEWGYVEDVEQVIAEWIAPHVTKESVAGEIGTGGGRVAARVAPLVKEFHAFDVSARMLDLVRNELRSHPAPRFHHLTEPRLPQSLSGRFDFMYSFDVWVHIDLHIQFKYLQEIERILKPGGKAFLHCSNLTTDEGWKRFAKQDHYTVEGFYFMTPQAVRTLVGRTGLQIVKEMDGPGAAPTGNFYYDRDFLYVVEKPA